MRTATAAGLEQARKGTRDLGVSLRREMSDAIGAQQKTLATRLEELEAKQQAEAARAAGLDHQVAQLNQRVAVLTDEMQTVRALGASESQQLRAQIRETDGRLNRVASFNNRPRERFEASRGKTTQISSGIYLHFTRVDPRFRRYHGWLQLVNEGKILWLRDQSVLQTVAFNTGTGTQRHDLIVTALTEGGVAGYLILPPQVESAPSSAAVGGL